MRIYGRTLYAASALALAAALPCSALAVEIGTWNVKHLGDAERDWNRTAAVIAPYDFVALQEVHGDSGVRRVESILERTTGIEWESLTSGRAVGRGSYKENYAFIWRAGSVEYTGQANTYIDARDVFAREPFAAGFKSSDGYEWVAGNVHVIWGSNDRSRSAAEVQALAGYLDYLETDIANGRPVLLMGDFNLNPSNAGWGTVTKRYRLAVQRGGSTLSPRNGRFANLYDNIVYRGVKPTRTAVDAFPARLGVTHKYARKSISDHAPVRMTLGSGPAGGVLAVGSDTGYRGNQHATVQEAARAKGRTIANTVSAHVGAAAADVQSFFDCMREQADLGAGPGDALEACS